MKRILEMTGLICLLLVSATVSAQDEELYSSKWKWLLKITGISSGAESMHDPIVDVRFANGELWIARVSDKQTQLLVSGLEYGTPIFAPQSIDVIALRGKEIVLIPVSYNGVAKKYDSKDVQTLGAVDNIDKLIGYDKDDPDLILFCTGGEEGSPSNAGFFSLSKRKVTKLIKLTQSQETPDTGVHQLVLDHLWWWTRVYGDIAVDVGFSSEEWPEGDPSKAPVDVFIAGYPEPWNSGLEKWTNISNCGNGYICGQPSLSDDKNHVVSSATEFHDLVEVVEAAFENANWENLSRPMIVLAGNGEMVGMTLVTEFGQSVKNLAGEWSKISAFAVAGLYVLGYLSLRFHITAVGISTELSVLDERYLFAGGRFIVYVGLCVCVLILLGLFMAGIRYMIRLLWPGKSNCGSSSSTPEKPRFCQNQLAFMSILLSVVAIQFVMVQPLEISDVLVRSRLPGCGWLRFVVLAEDPAVRTLYFAGLIIVLALNGYLLYRIRSLKWSSPAKKGSLVLATFLIAVQMFLIPINHGIIVADKTIPRVTVPGNPEIVGCSKLAWLVWEGSQTVTFAVWDLLGRSDNERSLVTLQRKKVETMSVQGYDHVYRSYFTSKGYKYAMELLLERGLSVDKQDPKGLTLLMKAVKRDCYPCVKMLLERGASTSITDSGGMSALDWAIQSKKDDMIFLLLKPRSILAFDTRRNCLTRAHKN